MASGILVLNAGSSSLKFALFRMRSDQQDADMYLRGQISGLGGEAKFSARFVDEAAGASAVEIPLEGVANHLQAMDYALDWITQHSEDLTLIGAGHRVVHGGANRRHPALVDDALLSELAALNPLAPHHQPHNLAAIHAIKAIAPEIPQVACFDTAFHATQDAVVRMLPLPKAMRDEGLQRYGFHGLSYEFISHELAALKGGDMPAKVVVAHLGNGASLCGMIAGKSAYTSMGFSTLDGLLMGTRCGALDPGVIVHLLHDKNMRVGDLESLLYNQSGLLGVSGISADMRTLLNSSATEAKQAVDLFCHSLLKQIGSAIAVLGGLDALVFTGGIGERAAQIREKVCTQLAWLGIELDEVANAANALKISKPASQPEVWVIPTNEELTIVRQSLGIMIEC